MVTGAGPGREREHLRGDVTGRGRRAAKLPPEAHCPRGGWAPPVARRARLGPSGGAEGAARP
ncbi:hypothetical protein ABZ820_38915, partial [Streptomyces diacarni]|uniref:hypothetical protein n=1 Tax=Streptomyces diacarni TaxID=2800381 RepID=UPI0033FAA9EE